MSILVIAARDDWPTDRVVRMLTGRGADVFRLDVAEFPQQVALNGRTAVHGWGGWLSNAHRTVRLDAITAAYFRAPNAFRFPTGMSGPEHRFAAAQARAGLGGILTALECRWVSHPAAMARAEYKPLQLAMARDCGLTVPPTLITNDPSAVRSFADDIGGPIVSKPVASPVFIEGDQLKTVYTRRLSADDLADLSGVETTAHLFQAWVDKAYEVRLTVVGRRLFAAEIHAGSPQAYEDWRSDYPALTYTPTRAPDRVAQAVRRLTSRLGLRFAACDFVVPPTGEWTFLEANPCGQWDWIQHHTGLPIAEAIADELQGVAP
ncbi:ATP-grasp ribosomal peptide maturase [Streptomyces rimosus]|uniref:ATP-grasp ribosomal peptide maturase n=1 Tax=Streptomyces rimosus TaxID=1927 RepID=UPI0004CB7E99|nr:ATP-grasp ribosomal peptide maturase [Streptomyces rimosus]